MVSSEELIGTTECLTVYSKCPVNWCRYNRVVLYCGIITSLLSSLFCDF
jgi:hypothetical protein